jgi:glycosyltransferase involved in cell wall biosynthesis
LARQAGGPPGLVTVVDDASDPPVEGNVPMPAGLQVRILRLAEGGGPARARNTGARASQATLLAFVDDDVDADAGWLEQHLAVAGPAATTVSIGPLLAPPDWRPTPWNRWEAATLANEYGRMARGEYEATFRQFFTGNAVVPRALFEAAGGFDERFLRAEDVELGIRLGRAGAHFAFTPGAIGWHYARRSLASWRRIPRQYAFYDQVIGALHDPGWGAMIDRELAGRSGTTRAFLRAARAGAAGAVITSAATYAGIALSRRPMLPIGQRLLSLAWQAEYVRARAGVGNATETAALGSTFGGAW